MEYALCPHLGAGTVTHVLRESGLEIRWEKSGRTETIPFGAIRELNLRAELSGIYSLRIAREGGSAITIPARHFVSLGRFEDRGAEYLAFVRALHEAVARTSPSTRFVAGSTVLAIFGWLMVSMGVAFVGLIAWGVATGHGSPPLRVVWVLPLAFVIGGGFVRQGGAKPYDPAALPQKLLPRGG